jgi:hypothetical protein
MVTPILIMKNTNMINSIKSTINLMLPRLQTVVENYSSITESFDILKIRDLLVKVPQSTKDLESIIKLNIIANAEVPGISGRVLNKRLYSEFLDIPDCGQLLDSINALRGITSHDAHYSLHHYFTISFDDQNQTFSASKVENIDAVIEEKYSYYTRNDNQVDFVTKVNQLLDTYTYLKRFEQHRSLKSALKQVSFLNWNLSGEYDCTIIPSFVYAIN